VDWLTNLLTWRKRTARGRVNRGDYRAAQKIVTWLRGEIRRSARVEWDAVSKGGAQAAAGAALTLDMGIPTALHLYASKRAAGQEFYDAVRSGCVEVSHIAYPGDVVPYLPIRYGWIEPTMASEHRTWLWTAHMRAVRHAAAERHRLSKRLG
jgi:hypothetical protein